MSASWILIAVGAAPAILILADLARLFLLGVEKGALTEGYFFRLRERVAELRLTLKQAEPPVQLAHLTYEIEHYLATSPRQHNDSRADSLIRQIEDVLKRVPSVRFRDQVEAHTSEARTGFWQIRAELESVQLTLRAEQRAHQTYKAIVNHLSWSLSALFIVTFLYQLVRFVPWNR